MTRSSKTFAPKALAHDRSISRCVPILLLLRRSYETEGELERRASADLASSVFPSSVLPSRRNGRDASLKKVSSSLPCKHLLDCHACADDPSISSQNGFLGWGDLSGQHLSHSFEDELFEPLDDDHFAAEDQPEKAKGATEDSKVDALWLRLVDRSLEMVRIRPPSTLAPPLQSVRLNPLTHCLFHPHDPAGR